MPGETAKSGITIIINAASGSVEGNDLAGQVCEAFSVHLVQPEIFFCDAPHDVVVQAEKAVAAGCRTVVAGGGDGTVSTVASIVAGTDTRLGVLPLGTLNHFAKDAGIPLDLDGAVATIAEGHTVTVDVGEVNGRTFINNSSLGLYPRVVRHRESQQRMGRSKWWAFLKGMLVVIGRYPLLQVTLSTEKGCITHRTPFLFIGNNEYEIHGLNIGSRARIDSGLLAVYLTHDIGRFGLLMLILRGLVGRLRDAEDFIALTTPELQVDVPSRLVRVALDGEVVTMEPSLRYRCRRQDLRVIVPER